MKWAEVLGVAMACCGICVALKTGSLVICLSALLVIALCLARRFALLIMKRRGGVGIGGRMPFHSQKLRDESGSSLKSFSAGYDEEPL